MVDSRTKTELSRSPVTEDNFFDPVSAHVKHLLLPDPMVSERVSFNMLGCGGVWGDS